MSNKSSISCGVSLDITEAESLKKRLLKALSESSTIELKAESVTKVDTAGLQLCIALQKDLALSEKTIIWKNPSQELMDGVKLLGLSEDLQLIN